MSGEEGCPFCSPARACLWHSGILGAPKARDPRPCKGLNSNVCVGEGCYDESCRGEPTTPVPSEATEAGEVEALGTWIGHYLGNYTFPANYAAPLYGQTHREVAKYVGPVIAEDLLDSPALADLLDRVRREAKAEAGEQIAQAIEATQTFAHGNNPTSRAHVIGFGAARKCAARIARSTP